MDDLSILAFYKLCSDCNLPGIIDTFGNLSDTISIFEYQIFTVKYQIVALGYQIFTVLNQIWSHILYNSY
jgi:hypothetical protein